MKVKFGVIGADPKLRANFVFRNFDRGKGELVAICDIDPDSIAAFREAYPEMANIRTYSDYRELLADSEKITSTSVIPTISIMHYWADNDGHIKSRHSESANILWADGHVGSMKAAADTLQRPYIASPGPNTRNPYFWPSK